MNINYKNNYICKFIVHYIKKCFHVILILLLIGLCFFDSPKVFAYPNNIENNVNEQNNSVAKIYVTNDIHGGINNSKEDSGLCYSAAAQLKKDSLKKGENTYLIDAGDHTYGSFYANVDLGTTMLKAMKSAQYDFAVPGNHEFDAGFSYFYDKQKYIKSQEEGMSSFDYYACNLWHVDHGVHTKPVLDPYKIIETKEGVKIAFLGIMTPETIGKTAPGFFQDKEGNYIYGIDAASKDDVNEPMYKRVQENIDKIRNNKEADIVIGVGHLGVESTAAFNQSTELIKHTSGFDAFADGHSHTELQDKVADKDNNLVPRLQTGTEFANIGEFEITGSKDNGFSITNKLISSEEYGSGPRDTATLNIERDWCNIVDSQLIEKVATTQLTFYDNIDPVKRPQESRLIRKRETNLTDLCSDSMYWAGNSNSPSIGKKLECDAAFSNAGGIRNQILPGDITYKSCVNINPFFNLFAIAEMPGQVLLDALEYSTRNYTKAENGGLLHVSGMCFQVDVSKPSKVKVDDDGMWVSGPTDGDYRVHSIKIYNKQTSTYEDIDLKKNYKIAGIDYLFSNYGDGYLMFRNKNVKVDNQGVLLCIILKDYLSAFSTTNLNNNNENNIPIIDSSHSPLAQYKNFMINYEKQFGANRFGVYSATFDTLGGSYVPMQFLYPDSCLNIPDNPLKNNYSFEGWFADSDCQEKFDFDTKINKDSIIYAKWQQDFTPTTDGSQNQFASAQTGDCSSYIFVLLTFICISLSLLLLRRNNNNSRIYYK